MSRTFERPLRRSCRAALAALAGVASLMLPAGLTAAEEPAPSGRSDQGAEVAVGLPPVPIETVPDATPATPEQAPEPAPQNPSPNRPTTHVRVAVGLPPVPTSNVPDAVALSLW